MLSRRTLANAIRFLSIDAVELAKSGHPGSPMGMADIAEVLWHDFLRHNPKNPNWFNRDRFVFSNGHGAVLLYSLLHLTGYDLSVEDLKQFRQFHSKTPGHPEFGGTPGVETSTGPLGQGIANAVGMALAEKCLAAQFNRPGFSLVDHYTYLFLGDGCLMEGISHEACSLAGTLALGKLIAFYDDNGISIDGEVIGWFTDDTAGRFTAYGWHVVANIDGHDGEAVAAALKQARQVSDRPSLLICKTKIGYGAPNKEGSAGCHGSALGSEEVALARDNLGWPHAPFIIPNEIYQEWNAIDKGRAAEQGWQICFDAYKSAYPDLAKEFIRRIRGELPLNWSKEADLWLDELCAKPANLATRKASQNSLAKYATLLPELLGGSADLTPSNLTDWPGSRAINYDPSGNYMHYGVREFGMSAIMNGIALHGGFIPYGGTFLVFSDYARNAIRMAALMRQRVIFVYTHDSIGLGEDGPTHQPIEQLSTLRLIPNLAVWRPCDQVESAVAWRYAIERTTGPSALLFSRQNLPQQERDPEQLANISRGAYILKESKPKKSKEEPLELILIASGSEISLAMEAFGQLEKRGYRLRLVSMPCTDQFEAQDEKYRSMVLPPEVTARVAVEAGSCDLWYRYVGLGGRVIGLHGFGASAPADKLFAAFGLTVENIVHSATELLGDPMAKARD